MGDRASAERACKDQNPIIDGRKANVNLAILGAKPRGNVQAGKFRFCFIGEEAWSLPPPGSTRAPTSDVFSRRSEQLQLVSALSLTADAEIYSVPCV